MFKLLKKYSFISILTALVVANNIVAFTPSFELGYYIFMLVTLCYMVFKGGLNLTSGAMVMLYAFCAISIIFNVIPSFFRPWERLISFIIVSLLVSPAIGSRTLSRFRCQTFTLLQYLMAVMAIISFPLYLMGINSMALETGGQSGVTTHSMLMGPVAANAFLFAVYKLIIEKKWQHGGFSRMFFLGVAALAFPMILLSLSRTTILAAMGGFLALIVLKSKFKTGHFVKFGIIVFAIGALTFPVWQRYTIGVEEKNQGSINAGGLTSSRSEHWQNRIDEFKSSPFVGIGFSTVEKGNIDVVTGKVETGNSWLSVLSMTGIIGFAAFFMMVYGAIKRVRLYILHANAPSYCLVGSLIAFYSIHMFAEGYIFGAGNFLFFNMWLIFGVAYAIPQADMRKVAL